MRPPSPPRPSAPECYFRDIDQTPLLSPDEERALARRIAEGDAEARDHLTRANLRLVVCIAKAYAGKGLGLEDLIAEGNLGLLRAVEGYDPSMNTRFSTYASYWVKQSIRRALVNTGRTVRIPVYMSQLVAEWRREAARLEDELGRPPAEGEVAAALGLSPRKLKLVRKALRVHNSGRPSGTEHFEGLSVDDTFLDDRAAAPEAAVSAAEDVRQVLDGLDALGGRAAAVLRLRYGLGGEEPLTLQEVGVRLGLTRERVRQIEKEALAALRERVEAAEEGASGARPAVATPPSSGSNAPGTSPARQRPWTRCMAAV